MTMIPIASPLRCALVEFDWADAKLEIEFERLQADPWGPTVDAYVAAVREREQAALDLAQEFSAAARRAEGSP